MKREYILENKEVSGLRSCWTHDYYKKRNNHSLPPLKIFILLSNTLNIALLC